jgi:DNA-binding beta-propeller fold protein YncE
MTLKAIILRPIRRLGSCGMKQNEMAFRSATTVSSIDSGSLYPRIQASETTMTRILQAGNKEFQQFVKNGNLPQLEILRLPNDHTKGTAPGSLSPQSYVAQNDLAVGKLVDAVSHSPYWKDTAIFITEDDAQDGPDHVDAHRTESLVISPYTQKGTVDSTFYDTASMLKTIELILGMKPLTQYDAAATPMLNTFTTHPNFKPYVVVGPTYPLDRFNSQNAPLAKESSKMDFSREDAAPDDLLNLAIWKATKGNVPYPKDLKKQDNN